MPGRSWTRAFSDMRSCGRSLSTLKRLRDVGFSRSSPWGPCRQRADNGCRPCARPLLHKTTQPSSEAGSHTLDTVSILPLNDFTWMLPVPFGDVSS